MTFEIDTARFLLGLMWQQLWIGGALVMLVSICLRTNRRLNAATRHWIWALTLVTVALLPLPAFFPGAAVPEVELADLETSPAQAGPTAVEQPPALVASDDTQAKRSSLLSTASDSIRNPALMRGLATSLALFWAAGTLWMLFRLLLSARNANRFQRESNPAPLSGKPADIRLSSLARSPMVVGFRRPSILIPASLFEHLSRDELQRILDHELAHLRRGDQWLMLLQKLIEAVYFFHPAVHYAARRFDDEREISCDDRAALDQRNHYADSLIRICKAIVAKPSPAPLAVGAVRSRNQLTRRISLLLDGNRNHAPHVSRAGLALNAVALMATMACAIEFMPRIARADEPQTQLANVHDEYQAYGTPLIAAAANGDVASMRSLIEGGADVNEAFTAYEPRTPLNAAARAGHVDAVKLLLSYDAEVDRVVSGDATALIDAARGGHAEIVALLLEDGADPNRVVRGDGSALAVASGRGIDEMVAMLLAHGANPDVLTAGDPDAMMQAAWRGDIATLERLAAAGGDVNRVNRGDGTPLIAAARRGSMPAAEWLLDHGADVDLAARGDGNPLIMAASMGHVDVVQLLLERGAEIDAVVPGDETALISSARSGAIDTVRLLLERGADVNLEVPVDEGAFGETQIRTALNQAEAGDHEDVAALLVAYGARR